MAGPSTGASYWPSISADGEFVAYTSTATDMVPEDDDPEVDVFVTDIDAQSTVSSLSISASWRVRPGVRATRPVISANGRYVAFASNAIEPGRGLGGEPADLSARSRPRADLADEPPRGCPRASRSLWRVHRAWRRTAARWPSSRRRPTSCPGTPNDVEDVFVRTPDCRPARVLRFRADFRGLPAPRSGARGTRALRWIRASSCTSIPWPPEQSRAACSTALTDASICRSWEARCASRRRTCAPILLWSTPSGAGACGGRAQPGHETPSPAEHWAVVPIRACRFPASE